MKKLKNQVIKTIAFEKDEALEVKIIAAKLDCSFSEIIRDTISKFLLKNYKECIHSNFCKCFKLQDYQKEYREINKEKLKEYRRQYYLNKKKELENDKRKKHRREK